MRGFAGSRLRYPAGVVDRVLGVQALYLVGVVDKLAGGCRCANPRESAGCVIWLVWLCGFFVAPAGWCFVFFFFFFFFFPGGPGFECF